MMDAAPPPLASVNATAHSANLQDFFFRWDVPASVRFQAASYGAAQLACTHGGA